MSRLHRPYIPLKIRREVAARQFCEKYPNQVGFALYYRGGGDGAVLKSLLIHLFGDRPYNLDHDPALENRRLYVRHGKTFYDPPANDPAHLIYREGGKPGDGSEHDIKTRVRGPGARLSDHAEARKRKRVSKNRELGRGAAPARKRYFRSSTAKLVAKRKWPAKGTRKVQWWKR